MYQRILVPLDGSPASLRGLDEAIRLSELTGAVLRLVHVVDEQKYVTGFERLAGGSDLVLLMVEAGERILQQGRERAEHAGVQTETLLFTSVSGRLCDLVVEQADAWNADLIVMGSHGRRGRKRGPLGSRAEEILRLATVPVVLVRSPSSDDEAGSDVAERVSLTT